VKILLTTGVAFGNKPAKLPILTNLTYCLVYFITFIHYLIRIIKCTIIIAASKIQFIIQWRLRPQIVYAHALNAYLHRIPLRHDRQFATPALICFLFDHLEGFENLAAVYAGRGCIKSTKLIIMDTFISSATNQCFCIDLKMVRVIINYLGTLSRP
jgi:hypothetical protein